MNNKPLVFSSIADTRRYAKQNNTCLHFHVLWRCSDITWSSTYRIDSSGKAYIFDEGGDNFRLHDGVDFLDGKHIQGLPAIFAYKIDKI